MVTGVGLVLPLGLSSDDVWAAVVAGQSAVGPWTRFDIGRPSAAAEVPAFDIRDHLRVRRHGKFMGRSTRFAVRAAHEAMAVSGLNHGGTAGRTVGVYTGSGETGLDSGDFLRALDVAWRDGDGADFGALGGRPSKAIDPFFLLRTLSNGGLGVLAMELEAEGPSHNFVQSEVASAQALAAACRDLGDGRCDVAVACGHDGLVNVSTFLAYDKAGLLSRGTENGSGLALAEGAAVLVLERPVDAEARGAAILGRILGVGTAVDPHDEPGTTVSADVIGAAVTSAAEAGEPPAFVVARGIGIDDADPLEAEAIGSAWPSGPPVTAFKPQTGYLGAATAVAEVSLALLALSRGTIPPTTGFRSHRGSLDIVRGSARDIDAPEPTALCLSGSWVGQAAAVLVSR